MLRITEAARELGIHPDTLRNLERSGRIPPVARDWAGARRYTLADVDRLRDLLFRAQKGDPADQPAR